MAYKIGFNVEDEELAEEASASDVTKITTENEGAVARKSVVKVRFDDSGRTLAYFNDKFDLHVGDIVYVDGDMEGARGRVIEVNYSFKIKLSNYKRVIAAADTDVHGSLFMAGSHFIAFERNTLPKSKIVRWFMAPDKEDTVYEIGNDFSESFALDSLKDMKIRPDVAERGHNYYLENRVCYLSLDNGHGYAIIEGGESYEVEFEYRDGLITNLCCTCFCTFNCKHEFAAMLQLKELLSAIEKSYSEQYASSNYFAAINKATFFDIAISTKDYGSFTL